MYAAGAESVDTDDLAKQFRILEDEAVDRLHHEGVADKDAVLQRGISMRYQGQWRSLQVPMNSGEQSLKRRSKPSIRSMNVSSRFIRMLSRWRSISCIYALLVKRQNRRLLLMNECRTQRLNLIPGATFF